ncbi:contactin-4-like isoform X1 [Bufo gargarizans]|uniref:contactin-4-like isoform X1 n=1 Tax=Bufo gargarizans TaxID=30331 RepID=UPI001CF1F769|nr:contactin-4-like isoform X1 [Bufo gargarizans]
MKLLSILALVFRIWCVLGSLPIPELIYKDNIIEDDDTEITCGLHYTDPSLVVNLKIKGNATLQNCVTRKYQSKNGISTNETCTLEVTKEMDKMEFICEAQFKTQSEPKKMYLQTEPTITDCPNNLVWIEKEENSFHCEATGYPLPIVTCRIGNTKYSEGVKFRALRNMTGTYICTAKNFDQISKPVEVIVQYKPEVLEIKVSPPLHNDGDTVTMMCKADGEPAPTYSWETPSSNVQFSPDNTTITIQTMTKSHLGKYSCTARNKHGHHSLKEDLTLEAKPKISEVKVEPSVEVFEGNNVTVSCEASGFPPPTLSWVHPKAEVQVSKDKRTVKIWGIKKEHMGNYSCAAQNKYGTVTQSQQITLSVKPKVLSINIKPSIPVSEKENLILTCVAQGIPRPTYSWHLPTPNVHLSSDNSTINISAAQKAHEGDYSCTAQNKHGRDTMTKRITVKEKGNGADRREMSVTTILSLLIATSLMIYLS